MEQFKDTKLCMHVQRTILVIALRSPLSKQIYFGQKVYA